jgi:hypothetical protein
MTPQPVGAHAYTPLLPASPQVGGQARGKFAADLRAALSPQEKQAIESVFGSETKVPVKRPAAPVVALGRHVDVQA